MKKIITIAAILLIATTSCDLNYLPYDGFPESELFKSDIGIKGATVGNYNQLKDAAYQRGFHFFGEYGGDNLSLSGPTRDHLIYCYNYEHFSSMGPTTYFWESAYRLIVGCNKVIQAIDDNASAEMKHLKGENLFLRAQALFHLSNCFGRPYYQSPETNLSVPIKLDDLMTTIPPRSTVKDVYNQVIADLLIAEQLMGSSKSNAYASKEVAQALLSRVYLYMSGTPEKPNQEYAKKSIEYADKVINSGRYSLIPTQDLKNYFTWAPESNKETIFEVKHIVVDDRNLGAIGALYNIVNGKGWGQLYPSQPMRELIDQNPEDARRGFIVPQYAADGVTLKLNNGLPVYYITKFSLQEGYPTLSSPVHFRLAEMYLNRAEASAKLGKNQDAIDDVNLIRTRAGLTGEKLYTVSNLKGRSSVFAVVLEERRIELMFEAQRRWDIFRNGLTLDRNYPGIHTSGKALLSIPATHPRVVFFIPESQMLVQSNLVQNP